MGVRKKKMGCGGAAEAAPENSNVSLETHDASLDFGDDFEGISAYELAGCFIGGCYLPIMTTTYMICPEDHDHYTACGCSNCGPLPIPWSFPYKRRPGTNSFQRSDNPDEDMGEFASCGCTYCMAHKIWWACKILPCQCCYTVPDHATPPLSHTVPAESKAPGQLGESVNVTVMFNGSEEKTVTIEKEATAVQLKLKLFENGEAWGVTETVPPPAGQCLNFGGHEMLDNETFAQHDIEEGAIFNVTYTEGFKVDFTYTNQHLSTSTRRLTLWPEETLLNGLARALHEDGVGPKQVARALYDKCHYFYHREPEGKKLGDNNTDVELNLYSTCTQNGLKDQDVIAVCHGEVAVDLISTEEIAGCWFCVCAPCMFTACFRKEANGEDGLIHKGCLLCPIPIPFEEHRSRKGRSNIFTNDDPNNMDHYRSSGLVTNGSSFSLKLCN